MLCPFKVKSNTIELLCPLLFIASYTYSVLIKLNGCGCGCVGVVWCGVGCCCVGVVLCGGGVVWGGVNDHSRSDESCAAECKIKKMDLRRSTSVTCVAMGTR